MPVTLYQGEEREYIINSLSSEIDILYAKIKDMYHTNKVLNEGKELLKKHGQTFNDDSQLYRQTFVFIAVLAIENNAVIKNLLLSKSETEDLPLIKNGVITMQEGCKKLIGFYNSKGGDKMVKSSLLYKVYSKFDKDSPEIYTAFAKHVSTLRNKLESENTKKLRDTLVHFQADEGEFNPFEFIDSIFKIDANEVFSPLFSYCLFLRYTLQSLGALINLEPQASITQQQYK